MLRHAFCFAFLSALGVVSASVGPVDSWLVKSDSLRGLGQDAASLDFLRSAQREFEDAGDPCSVALIAGRRAQIHVDWKNPLHADAALSEAVKFSLQCPDLADFRVEWSLSLAQANLEQGKRAEARHLLLGLARMTESEVTSDVRKALAVEAM